MAFVGNLFLLEEGWRFTGLRIILLLLKSSLPLVLGVRPLLSGLFQIVLLLRDDLFEIPYLLAVGLLLLLLLLFKNLNLFQQSLLL